MNRRATYWEHAHRRQRHTEHLIAALAVCAGMLAITAGVLAVLVLL